MHVELVALDYSNAVQLPVHWRVFVGMVGPMIGPMIEIVVENSGPARNQKLLEVQKEDSRRDRVFRLLSLLIPGAGHLYANQALIGLPLVFLWSGILAIALLAYRMLPLTEAAGAMSPPWGMALGGLVLLILYIAANRVRPDFDVRVTARRPPPQRARRKAA